MEGDRGVRSCHEVKLGDVDMHSWCFGYYIYAPHAHWPQVVRSVSLLISPDRLGNPRQDGAYM